MRLPESVGTIDRRNLLFSRAQQNIVCQFFENISPHERAISLKRIVEKYDSYQNASLNADKSIIDDAYNDYANYINDHQEINRYRVDPDKFFDLLRNTCNLPVQANATIANIATPASDDDIPVAVATVVDSNIGGRKSRKYKKSKKSKKYKKSKKSKKYRK
jgi:hypothetical protein